MARSVFGRPTTTHATIPTMSESLVVLERGTELPRWIDAISGLESNVFVVSQREREGEHAFEARVLCLIEAQMRKRPPSLGVLVCRSEGGRAETTRRAVLLLALRELTEKSSGRVVVSAPADADPSIAELGRLLGAEVSEAPAERTEPVARRVA
jgi:hypothetical protein